MGIARPHGLRYDMRKRVLGAALGPTWDQGWAMDGQWMGLPFVATRVSDVRLRSLTQALDFQGV